MSAVDVVLQVFRSVEERNPQLAAEVYHDDLEFHWPRPLPYAGSNARVCRMTDCVQGGSALWFGGMDGSGDGVIVPAIGFA